jgi:REP element-mobilizing transposase RayT
VDRAHSAWKGRYLNPDPALQLFELSLLRNPPVRLDENERLTVVESIRKVCQHEGWPLHAAHVRSNHVHVVVSGDGNVNAMMAKLKAYASRALNARFGHVPKRWTRHGSTVWLWDRREVDKAVGYVLQDQGSPMARYENPARWQDYLGG